MSLSNNFPTIKPSLMLDFANTGSLDPRVSFARASTATYYDGVTTAMAEQNLLTYSQEFDNAAWIKGNVGVTANSTTAPDGTSTAETLDDLTATNVHNINESITTSTGTTYTLSAFMKNVDRQYAILACSASTTSWASAKFDLLNGTLGSTSQSGAGWSTTSSSITSVGSGWYRCSITFVVGTTTGNAARIGLATDGTTFTAGERGLETYTGTNKQIYAWGTQLEQRSAVSSYTVTATQPITTYIPVLQTAAANVARFDHNPTTGEALGLLVEEQRTNLFTYSSDFSNAAWTKTRSSITADIIVAPDGTLTGDKLVEDTTASSSHNLAQTSSFTSGTTYTYSIFVKQGERTALRVLFPAAAFTSNLTANFNISTGAWHLTSPSPSAGLTLAVSDVGNGWYRISVTATATATASSTIVLYTLDSVTSTGSYTGDGYSGIYIWGAQLEAGAFPTSYIPTPSNSQVTRTTDSASMTGTNFSSWFNNAEGTAYSEAQINFAPIGGGGAQFYSIDNGGTDVIQPYFSNSTGILYTYITVSNVQQANTGNTVIQQGQMFKHAQTYQVNNFASVVNNGTASTDATGTVPTVTQIRFTYGVKSTYFKKFAYYPERLSNAQLQALTS